MPGRSGVEAVVSDSPGQGDPAAGPDIRGYPSRLMRGTSTITRVCAAVASQALQAAGVDPSTIPSVFGSAYGEVTIAVEQLEMMVVGDGQISPARFKNSVHNASSGIFSIAHDNRLGSTSLASGPLTVAHALLEAEIMLHEGAAHVLVVVGDEALPEPLARLGRWPTFAAAWVLGRERPSASEACIRLDRLEPVPAQEASVPPSLAEHPERVAHPLLAAIHRREAGRIALGDEGDEAWSISVHLEPEPPR